MGTSFKHPLISRVRKPSGSIYKILRLNRAEYGHTFKSKKKKKVIITDTIQMYHNFYQTLDNILN